MKMLAIVTMKAGPGIICQNLKVRPGNPVITKLTTVVVVVLETVEFGGLGGVSAATGARARTMGRAKAETTMPVVMKSASSRQGLLALSSL